MVLETLKKSLTTFTDSVTSPVQTITNVTSSMKKSVIGPDVNLLEKIEDHIANESFQKLFSRSIATLKRTIGKSDIAATKKKVLQAALTACLTELKAISHSDQFAKEAQKITKALEKAIKAKELITGYEKGNFVSEKAKLTDKDVTILLPLIQEEDIVLREHLKEAQENLTDQLRIPCTSSYAHKEERKLFHDDWRKQIDSLIDDEYAISKQQKKLTYSIYELERQADLLDKAESEKRKGSLDKDLVRRMNAAKQKIEVLTKKEIPGLFSSISKALDVVIQDEKNINTTWNKQHTAYTLHEKELYAYFNKNLQETKKIVTKEVAQRKKTQKSLETLVNKLEKAKTSIETALPKVAGQKQVDIVTGYVEQEDTLDASIYTKELEVYGSYYLQISSHHKDILVSQEVIGDIIQRWYTVVGLGKERITQLKILNTNKKRHAISANTIWSSLIRIDNMMETKITSLIASAKKQLETFKQQTLDYQKEIGSHTKDIRDLRRQTKELHTGVQANNELKEWIQAVYTKQVLSSYVDIMKRIYERNKTHITTLKKTEQTLIDNKKTAEKEKDFFSKKQQLSAAEKKKLSAAAETLHASELALDIITHHIEVEEEHAKDTTYLLKAYTKQLKWEDKKITFYNKLCTRLYDKIKKNAVCKQLVLSPKKLSGTNM